MGLRSPTNSVDSKGKGKGVMDAELTLDLSDGFTVAFLAWSGVA
jgi:hypothetical protein